MKAGPDKFGAVYAAVPLPGSFWELPPVLLLLEPWLVDLRNSLRHDSRSLRMVEDVDDEIFPSEKKYLKNLGRVGRQPTMMPIAISAKLVSVSKAPHNSAKLLSYLHTPAISMLIK